MKQCPQCKLVYADVDLNFCLDDGAVLVERIADSEPATAILSESRLVGSGPFEEADTRAFIHTTQSEAEPRGSLSESPEKQSFSANRAAKPLLVVAVVAVLVIAGFIGYRYFASANSKQIESIAVMPFVNDSGNADVEYLSDGMTETLIRSLSSLANLDVKPRSAVFRYKGKDADASAIAKELNVQGILNGRVSQRGDQLTLSLELVDALRNRVVWSEQYNRKTSDIVSLQSEIAKDVSTKLTAKLSGADIAKIEKNYTTNSEAYQLYLKGKFAWNKRTGSDLKQAVEFYRQSIEIDPNYALAYSGLAETYVLFPAYDVASSNDSMPQAKAAAMRALEIDDSLAEAHTALGKYLSDYERKTEEGIKELQRAVALKPNYATGHHWLGMELSTANRFDEGIASVRRALEIDPLSQIIGTNLGDALVYARRYDEAIAQYKRVLASNPNFWYAHQALGAAYGFKGMYTEAIAESRLAIDLNQGTSPKGYLAFLLAKSGEREQAKKILAELNQQPNKDFVKPWTLALVYIGLGEKDEALKWIEKEAENPSETLQNISAAPEVDHLRSEPRFKAMLKRMNLPE